MNINQLGYVFADGDFKNLINKTDDSTTTFYSGSAITTNSIRSGDTISIEVYTTPTNLSTIITKSTYTYNDSPDRRYATEYINVEAIAALPSGDIYAIIKGSANWDYSRLLKIDKATSSIEISDEQTPFVNQYKFFINGNELFLSGGGLYKLDSNLKNRTLLESYSVKDVEFTDDGWIYISPNESTLSTIKKINFNGELDLSFGASGIFSRDIEKYDYEFVNDIALSQTGYIFAISLLGTQKPTPNQRPGIIKLLPSGKVDPTFGVGGIISGDAYTYIANPKIVIQNNEKPIVAYLSDNKYLIIQRYTSAGQLDQEFSFGGTFKFELPNKYGYPVVLESEIDLSIDQDSILVTTHAYGGIVRIKLSSQGIPDTSFGNISNTNSPDSTSPLLLEYKLNNLTLELKFNEDVLVGSGGLALKNSNNGATQEIIPSALSEGIKENTIRIPLNPYISPSQEYKITLRENFIQDLAGNANLGGSILSIITESPPPTPKFWNNPAKTPSETGKSAAIDLSDAIAILKMIVGLNVNDNRTPLSPYQSLAADFNQNGDVGLEDAIGVLKKIVGLSSPEPTWKYFDDSKVKTSLTGAESLKPNTWIGDASIADLLTASPTVNVVGVLTGDVNGNWI